MKTTKTSRLARVMVMALAVCMIACLVLPLTAEAANDAVNDCRYGVLQVKLNYIDDNNTPNTVSAGTGFLINDNTLITCHHVVNLSNSDLEDLAEAVGKTVAEVQSRLNITVTVSRDVTIAASKLTESFEMDFSILRLSSSLQGKTPLAIRPSAEVKQTESVYTIGFPSLGALLQSYNTYTSDDATITQGVVNKIAIGVNMHSGANTNYIQTSCNLDYGNSGGPMVDENGYVIGISQGVWSWAEDSTTEYYNAIAIDQVTEVLDALGIIYISANTAEPEPTQAPVVTPPPATQAPVVTAPPATLPPIEVPEEPAGNNMGLILIIAAVAVVVIVVVVVVLVAGKKKPAAPAPVPTPAAPPVRPVTPPTNSGFAAPPTYPVQGAGETTVLGGGAGETTVLSRASVSGGTLIRKRTGETVAINAEQFVIGRERKGVNYCISDNSSISRNHVRLTVRGGTTYLTDLNAANGTFVNGVKVMPRQEVALKNGDKITLADEDLEFKN